MARSRAKIWLLSIVFALACTVTTLFIIYRKEVYDFLFDFADKVRDAGAKGTAILVLLLVACAFPPIPGYSTILITIGFVYSYPGFFLAYFGALLGGTISYLVGQWLLRDYVDQWLARSPNTGAVIRGIHAEGWKLILLVRVAPYPYGLVNWILAAANVPFGTFFLATAVSLFKVIIHIAVGASLPSLHSLVEDVNNQWWELVLLVISAILIVALFIYLYQLAQKSIARYAVVPQEDAATSSNLSFQWDDSDQPDGDECDSLLVDPY